MNKDIYEKRVGINKTKKETYISGKEKSMEEAQRQEIALRVWGISV